MTRDAAIQKVIALARSELGYHEQGNNVTKYAAYLDSYAGFYNGPKNGYAWCDVFVDWLFVQAFGIDIGRRMICQPLNSAGAGCLYSAQYYQQAGRFFKSPEIGDQIFFSYSPGEVSHTGLVESISGNTITTIEGNTSDSVGRRSYSIGSGSIYGYGRPDWDLVSSEPEEEEEEPEPENVLPEIRNGDVGSAVTLLQAALNFTGFNSGKADGEFGPLTQAAVNRARQSWGMDQNGIADRAFWVKLLQVIGG